MTTQGTSKRGLASADEQTRIQVARKGGETVSQNRAHMAEIGRKGGQTVSQNRAHMAEIGRKGGETVSQNREHMAQIGRKGGEARAENHHLKIGTLNTRTDQSICTQEEEKKSA